MIRAAFLATVILVGAAFSSIPANASTIDWQLSGVTFDDGGTASGTFSTNSTNGDVIAFDIVTTGGTTLGGTAYDSTASNTFSSNGIYSPNSFILSNFDTSTYVNFEFDNPLTGNGIDKLILSDGSYECNMCATVRAVVSGEAISDIGTAPIPPSIAIFATGLGVMGLLEWRRKRKNAAAGVAVYLQLLDHWHADSNTVARSFPALRHWPQRHGFVRLAQKAKSF